MPKKLTAYSVAELAEMKKNKTLDRPQLLEVKSILDSINYTQIQKRMVQLTKKEYKGKLTKEEQKEYDELMRRVVEPYFRMKRWFLKNGYKS